MTSIEVLNRNKVISGSSDHKLSGNWNPMISIEVLNRNQVMAGSSDHKFSEN